MIARLKAHADGTSKETISGDRVMQYFHSKYDGESYAEMGRF